MTPKAAPWLLLTLSAVVVVSVVLLFFGSGSILNFLRKLTVHYAIEWGVCALMFGAAVGHTIWERLGRRSPSAKEGPNIQVRAVINDLRMYYLRPI